MNRFTCTSTTTEFSFARKMFNLFIQFIDEFKFILVWPFCAVQVVVYSIKSPILHTLFYTNQKVLDTEKPNIKAAADNQLISCCWYMKRSNRMNYKVLVEIGEMEEKVDGKLEKMKTVEIDEISNLLKITSISKDISERLYNALKEWIRIKKLML